MVHRREPAPAAKHRVEEGISVFVRVRPTSAVQEAGGNNSQVVEVDEDGTCVSVRNAEQPAKAVKCAFDRVFGPGSGQQDIFMSLVPALDTVLKGFNACALAYGQTGSGKTHTLIGPGGGTKLPDLESEWGIIPRAVQFLFDRLSVASEEDETFSYSVTCSFLQIYNENLVDLLQQDGVGRARTRLQIREESGGGTGASIRRRPKSEGGGAGAGGGRNHFGETRGGVSSGRGASAQSRGSSSSRRVFVNGLSSFRVGGAQDVLRYVSLGAANRRVRATQHNEASSRSHAVLQLTVEVQSGGGGGGDGSDGDGGSGGDDGGDGRGSSGVDGSHVTYRQAKLSLVDLAGSEKMDSDARISKGHFNELRNINQSLSTLGNVVSALSEKSRTHVPYRDSKLTRLLQDSLGGNTRTTIIACVNPAPGQANETLNTLQFADRAKKVMVRLQANEMVDDRVLLARANAEIVRLKTRLREALYSAIGSDDGNDSLERQGPSWTNGRRVGSAPAGVKGEAAGDKLEMEGSLSHESNLLQKPEGTSIHTLPRSPVPPRVTGGEKSAAPVATENVAATTAAAAVAAAQRRHTAKLIAENERLRESNDRLKSEVQGLLQSNRKLKRRRQGDRLLATVGRGGRPFSPPVNWSARYAYGAADMRRRRPASSNSSLRGRRALPPRARSVSPGAASSAVAEAARRNLPIFRRRSFDGEGSEEGDGAPVEDALSPGEIQAMVGDEAGVSVPTTPRNQEEAEEVTQLEMFRRELERQASAVGAGTDHREGQARSGAIVVDDPGGGNKAYAEALLVRKSQRLEDLMFEAQGRERRRLREERGRLSLARTERLALEAQLARLTEQSRIAELAGFTGLEEPAEPEGPAEVTDVVDGLAPVPAVAISSTVPPIPTLSINEDVPSSAKVLDARESVKAAENKRGNRDQSGENAELKLGSERPLVQPAQSARNSSGLADPSAIGGVDTVSAPTSEPGDADSNKNQGPDSYREGNPPEVLAAGAKARRLVPAANIPERRPTGRISPISARRKPNHQRPSTSGGPAGRARSRRAHRWAGGSRSPVRGRATMLEPASAREHSSRGSSGKHRQQQEVEATLGRAAAATTASATKINALQLASPLAFHRQPRKAQGFRPVGGDSSRKGGRGAGGGGDLRVEVGEAAKGSLAYSVADLGLRLKVYSFRYDHHYECQVVGYDSRRRMHRCLYDATGEKQWHELANKRFEVVGQNGVVSRGTESAPPPSTDTPLLLPPPRSPSK